MTEEECSNCGIELTCDFIKKSKKYEGTAIAACRTSGGRRMCDQCYATMKNMTVEELLWKIPFIPLKKKRS